MRRGNAVTDEHVASKHWVAMTALVRSDRDLTRINRLLRHRAPIQLLIATRRPRAAPRARFGPGDSTMTPDAALIDLPSRIQSATLSNGYALGALLMAWDFVVKLRPLFPRFLERPVPETSAGSGAVASSEWPRAGSP